MVKAWREIVTIPTYEVGKAEKNPIFLEKRVYQGSSGVVYPYPVIESIADEPTPKEWQAVWLENEYIKVMVLPELGGRIQMAYDKVKQRHFVYYNHVIKPALVGLCGPWISGGIEFNWPQHHRPSTYSPVDSLIVENEDGSVTVWVNEMERMFHQKGAAGFTLRPGCAYLEIQGRVSNRTPLPQTFLWWANPAVEVNDQYQSVFPPDVNAVFDHGKRAVSSFPIATGTYYKMDYSAGVDISNYRNIPVPTSYMAVNSKYDFEGGYENDSHGGMLHVASHHFSPGKKQWTWGNGDFGRAWDRNLTEPTPGPSPREGEFRPYIELMAGVYTENQPDFTWLMPYEEKQFVQYFMPYREVGMVKQASKDFIIGLTPDPSPTEEGRSVTFKVLATSKQEVRIVLRHDNGEVYYDKVVTLSPDEVFQQTVDVKGTKMDSLLLTVGNLQWHAEPDEIRPIPDAAEAALPPEDTKTNDQLYLTGLHLEQYRHATWSALDYYEEALRRDPNDVRCLNQTGLWYLRRGRFDKAEPYLRKAVKIWQKRNPNPYDGEAVFNLALCLKYQRRTQEAYELFWKSTWNKAWADAGYFEAACISVSQGRYDDALDELNRCLIFNSCNHEARALKAAVLRLQQDSKQKGGLQMGSSRELNERLALIKESLQLDRFNYGIRYEQYLLTKDKDVLKEMTVMMHGNVYNYLELALDYAQAGLWQECIDILKLCKTKHPLTYYYIGWAQLGLGDAVAANDAFEHAEKVDSYCCFPNRLEDVIVLTMAKTMNPDGARAPYYLGCLYYDKRQYDVAIENWELSARLDPQFPTVWRNLALARFNKQDRREDALAYMERAFSLDKKDARVLMELDQLYKRLQKPHQERLNFLQQYPKLIQQRDDLVLEEITLLNQLGRYEEAKVKLDAHKFHPWEGGEGKVSGQYQICRVELAKKSLTPDPSRKERGVDSSAVEKATKLLEECLVYPPHLGEGKLYGAQDNDFLYFLGRYEEGTAGPTEPAAAMYYNDAKPDKIFYAGLCYRKLGQEDKARSLFHKLVNYGKQHIFDHVTMDYFAVSLPDLLIWEDSLDTKNLIHCKYMLALGYLGLGDTEKALRYLSEVEALDINHQGIQQLRTLIDSGLL
jgi:tetratricopeptide (TPR) repeat protein